MTGRTGITIGKLAREAGVSVETVRYYHKRGLLCQPAKPESGGYRRYAEVDIERIRFIKHVQEMGFSLAEIGELLAYMRDENCRATLRLMEAKLHSIENRLVELETIRGKLKSLMSKCNAERPHTCVMVRRFNGGGGGCFSAGTATGDFTGASDGEIP